MAVTIDAPIRTRRGLTRATNWPLLVRFGLAGLLNTAFGYGVFAVLVLTGGTPFAALVLATIAGIAFNFQTSRCLVFRSRGRWMRFTIAYAVVLALNWAALRLLRHLGLPSLLAQALLALPVAVVSFVMQRFLVFPEMDNRP